MRQNEAVGGKGDYSTKAADKCSEENAGLSRFLCEGACACYNSSVRRSSAKRRNRTGMVSEGLWACVRYAR